MQGRSGVYIWADMQADGRRADGGDGGSCLATAGQHGRAACRGDFERLCIRRAVECSIITKHPVHSASRVVQHYFGEHVLKQYRNLNILSLRMAHPCTF